MSVFPAISKCFAIKETTFHARCEQCQRETVIKDQEQYTVGNNRFFFFVIQRDGSVDSALYKVPDFIYPSETLSRLPLVLRGVSQHTGTAYGGHYVSYVSKDSFGKRSTYRCDDKKIELTKSFGRIQHDVEKSRFIQSQSNSAFDKAAYASVQGNAIVHGSLRILLFERSLRHQSFDDDDFMNDVVFGGVRELECIAPPDILHDLSSLNESRKPSQRVVSSVIDQINERNIQRKRLDPSLIWALILPPVYLKNTRQTRARFHPPDYIGDLFSCAEAPASILIPIHRHHPDGDMWTLSHVGLGHSKQFDCHCLTSSTPSIDELKSLNTIVINQLGAVQGVRSNQMSTRHRPRAAVFEGHVLRLVSTQPAVSLSAFAPDPEV
jgi:hypothetical protein